MKKRLIEFSFNLGCKPFQAAPSSDHGLPITLEISHEREKRSGAKKENQAGEDEE